MKKSIEAYVLYVINYSIRQVEIQSISSANSTTYDSIIKPLPYKNKLVQDSKLFDLIGKLSDLEIGQFLSLCKIEDKYVDTSLTKRNISNHQVVSLIEGKRRLARQIFHKTLEKGLPVENIFIFKYHFKNNTLMILIAFKVL